MAKEKSIFEYLKSLCKQIAETGVIDNFPMKSLFSGDGLKRKLGMVGLSLALASGLAFASKPSDLSPKNLVTQDTDSIYSRVEKIPQFPGGTNALVDFLRENIHYPVEAMEKFIQGKVKVSFVVEKDGTIAQVRVTESVHPLLDAEAMRVVQSMPKWIPGKQGDNTVRCHYHLPINFKTTIMKDESAGIGRGPEFPGGWSALKTYIKENLRYPEEAKRDGIKGRVLVTFSVERDGSITDVAVFRGVHPLLDAEAMRLVKSMPKWIPGQMGDEPRSRQALPIEFDFTEGKK